MLLAETREAREAVELGHPEVEQDDVGLRFADGRNNLAADQDLAHDLEVRRLVERAPDRRLHQAVVVRDEYAELSTQFRNPFMHASAEGLTMSAPPGTSHPPFGDVES